uniref:Putative secreted protein n=1 Tax=Anopheles marajoara TaxID=58244 RepID=A0A2M4C8T2_9DIPT
MGGVCVCLCVCAGVGSRGLQEAPAVSNYRAFSLCPLFRFFCDRRPNWLQFVYFFFSLNLPSPSRGWGVVFCQIVNLAHERAHPSLPMMGLSQLQSARAIM